MSDKDPITQIRTPRLGLWFSCALSTGFLAAAAQVNAQPAAPAGSGSSTASTAQSSNKPPQQNPPTQSPPAPKVGLQLKSRVVLPTEALSAAARRGLEQRLATAKQSRVIVQLAKPMTRQEREQLEQAGIRLLDYLGQDAWFATVTDARALDFASPAVIKGVPILSRVKWMNTIQNDDKISPHIRNRGMGSAKEPNGTTHLLVSYFADADLGEVQKSIGGLGGTITGAIPISRTLLIALKDSRLQQLAALDAIRWIETAPPASATELGRMRTQLRATVPPATNYSGAGIRVGILENRNAYAAHPDFQQRLIIGDTDAAVPDNHPTNMAGIIGGAGVMNASRRGFAPSTELYSYAMGEHVADYSELLDYTDDLQRAIVQHSIDVANNSWGSYNQCNDYDYGTYEGLCPTLDAIVKGAHGRKIPIVFSAGNERDQAAGAACYANGENAAPFRNYGTMNHPKAAKNIIAIGATDTTNNAMTQYSSWGPLADGRIKPDLVASGHHDGAMTASISVSSNTNQAFIVPGYPTTNGYYGYTGATSAAAAAATGCIALLLDSYEEKMGSGERPLPSTVKALLIHSALDLDDATSWYNPGPDYASGYGLIRIDAAISLVEQLKFREGQLNQGETDYYDFSVAAGEPSLKLTLAWDDEPATPNMAQALVNDLDLVVFAPDGTQHYPWTLDPAHADHDAVRATEDHTNVVEQVVVDAPAAGNWHVEIRGGAVPFGPQQYSLVSENALAGRVDVVQVLDRSGSMNNMASAGSNDPKIAVLRQASALAIEMMDTGAGDRLGLVQFNQDVQPFPPNVDTSLSELTGPRASDLLASAVPSIQAGGSTSIGDGLAEALQQFTSAPPLGDHDRSIILVTDGKENTPAWIADVQDALVQNNVAVYALGLGYGSGIDEEKLTDLAEATGGAYRITSNDLVFRKLFLEALAGSLDWSLITDPVEQLGAGQTMDVPVDVTGDQTGATFSALWDQVDHAVDLELRAPDGTQVSPKTHPSQVRCTRQARYALCHVSFPLTGGFSIAGRWTMRLRGGSNIGNGATVNASASAFARGGAQLQVAFQSSKIRTGQALLMTASLTRSGAPVVGATLDVQSDLPMVSVGNVLHDGSVDMTALTSSLVVNGDAILPGNRKLQMLSEAAGKDILQRQAGSFRLYDDGTHGDVSAQDGIYSYALTDNRIAGSYTFRVIASGIASPGGNATREWTHSAYVEVDAAAQHSQVSVRLVSDTADGSVYMVSVTPEDRFGNYLGPDHAVSAVVSFPGSAREVALDDQVNGTYASRVFVTASERERNATIAIMIDGEFFTTLDTAAPGNAFVASLEHGFSIPVGAMHDDYRAGHFVALRFGREVLPQLDVRAGVGYSEFPARQPTAADNYFIQLSADLKYRLLSSALSPYLTAGPGWYVPLNGTSRFGVNAGLGLEYLIRGAFVVQLGARYDRIQPTGDSFVTVQGGGGIRF